MFIVLALAVPFVFALWVWFDLPAWLIMIFATILILGGSLGLLGPAKGILVALQYRHLPQQGFSASSPRLDRQDGGIRSDDPRNGTLGPDQRV